MTPTTFPSSCPSLAQRELERFSAALFIQCMYHARLGRRHARRASRRRAALRIARWCQRLFRGQRSRGRSSRRFRKHRRAIAARVVQRARRSQVARRKVGDMRNQRNEIRRLAKNHACHTAAATEIQRHVRAIIAKRRVRDKRRIWLVTTQHRLWS